MIVLHAMLDIGDLMVRSYERGTILPVRLFLPVLLRFLRVELYIATIADAAVRSAAQSLLGDAMLADALGRRNPLTGKRIRLGLPLLVVLEILAVSALFALVGAGSFRYQSELTTVTLLDVALFSTCAVLFLSSVLLPLRIAGLIIGVTCRVVGESRAAGASLDTAQLEELKRAYGA